MARVKEMSNDIMLARNLEFILLNPSVLENDASTPCDLQFKYIEKFQVIDHFYDDHVDCYKVKFTVEGFEYIYDFMWVGDNSRLFYQSEISRDILEENLTPYLAQHIFNQI